MTVAMSWRNWISSWLPAIGLGNNSHQRRRCHHLIRASVLAASVSLFYAGSVGAVPPSWLTELPSVQAAMLAHERSLAGAASVECHLVYSVAPVVQCSTFTLTARAGAKEVSTASGREWVSRVAQAVVDCKHVRGNVCAPTPVCTYRVTVASGAALALVSSVDMNVCRPGWAKAIR